MKREPLRVAGVPEPYNLPWHMAMERGRFAEAGIDLQWHTVPEGTGRMCRMLRDGELDMAVLVTEGAVRDILNSGPHRIVSTFVESPLPWGVHVPARSDLREPARLKGVPFAISRLGSGSHIMAMVYAERLGWRPGPQDLEVVHNMEGAAARMAEGGPVIFLWETYVTSRYVEAGVMRRVDEVRGDWPGFVIVAREEFARAHPARLERALEVLRREALALREDPRSVELVMRNAGFNDELAREWLRHVRWKVGRPRSGVLQPLIGTLQDLGLVPEGAPSDPVVADTGSG
ncbi:MAG: ABC transporter substrate-binding protein [Flavobacteriales bacterium]|nr:ABC transporter substrate-binding protein [Flavobacteriales bacterium]MBK7943559.1 ABC transporter substrate-binding protein [Flavobacteriales bacterium]MBK8950631.1 ABC transporter substrate-binding protein [Flavobacteriales bacterium]MBK9699755.1 ABC transporter substrate-binding protein [Flavobacteriales bacterium]